MIDFNLDKPRRQSAVGTFFFFIYSVQKFIRGFWPLLVLYIFKGDASKAFQGIGIYVALALVLFWIIHSILSWRSFFFYIENDEFIVRKGYLRKIVTAIPLEKIVSINIKQGIFHQILGVVQLEVDSAGSKGKEIAISAISKSLAEELNNRISVFKSENEEKSVSEEINEEQQSKTILKLSTENLMRVGLSQNHLRGLLLISAFGYNIYYNIKDIFESEVDRMADEANQFLEHSDSIIIVVLVVFVLGISFLISMIETWLRFFQFKIEKRSKAFSISSGLLKKRNVTIPFSRVQLVRRSINPLQKWLGISMCYLKQANSTEQANQKDQIFTNVPGCTDGHFHIIAKQILGNWQTNYFKELKPHKAFAYRIFIISVIIFSAPIIGLSFAYMWVLWMLFLSVGISAFIGYQIYQRRKFSINLSHLKVESGCIARQTDIIELYKVQTVRFKQNFFQRRRNIGTLKLAMAGGKIKLNHIEKSDAVYIRDYILHHVIETKKSWM